MASNCSVNQKSQHYQAKVHNRRCVEVFPTALSQATEIVAELFSTLVKGGRRYFFHTHSAFELFGFDFLVREDGTLVLLEVNPSPSPALFGASSRCQLLQDCPALQSAQLQNSAPSNAAEEPGPARARSSVPALEGDEEQGRRRDAEENDHTLYTARWQLCFTHHGGQMIQAAQ
eukprot:GEMP01070027.1.p1 GENE.GEMP01070027.1~~GEMP01070027.1.p1  ORF type:complete len:174 (+),score=38.68 GEMP01070027.1:147-668(+)